MAVKSQNTLPAALKQAVQARTRDRRKARSSEVSVAALTQSSRNDLAPTLKLEPRNIADLKGAKRRSRKTASAQLERVIRSLKGLAYSVPIVINTNNEIIDGHIVAEALGHLGIPTVQCLIVEHLKPEDQRLLRLSLNRLGETGEWHLEELTLELQELSLLDMDMTLTGFDMPELDMILGTAASAASEPDRPAPSPNPVSRPGDLWLLGEHMLYCGDCRDPASYERLLGNQLVQGVFSDPPYNIKIEGVVSGLGKKKHGDFAMACGEMEDDQFRAFLADYLKIAKAHCSEGAVIFACMDWRQIDLLLMAGRDAGLNRINKAIWFKGSRGMGGLYRSAYEEVAVFCTAKSPATNNVKLGATGRDRMNVWEYAGANRKGSSAGKALKDHPTPKPIELVADALLDVTKRGDIVLDPFMGSGTTILACEREQRICRGIELDPAYVDVAIGAWSMMTGKPVIHANLRQTYEEVKEARKAEPAEPISS